MSKKYLLWDFDNTLAYRQGMWSQAIYTLLQEYGYKEVRVEDISKLLNTGFPWHSPEIPHKEFFKGVNWWDHMTQHFSKILEELGIDRMLSTRIARKVRNRYLDGHHWFLFDDTVPCLQKAKMKGYENVILSNHVPELPQIVKELGIHKYFSEIYTSADLGYEKPNIEIYKAVLHKLEKHKEITMIGDNYITDIEGAINAGLDAILVRAENTNNYHKHCNHLEEIYQFI